MTVPYPSMQTTPIAQTVARMTPSVFCGFLSGTAGVTGVGTDTSGVGTDTSGVGTDTSGVGADTSGRGVETGGVTGVLTVPWLGNILLRLMH